MLETKVSAEKSEQLVKNALHFIYENKDPNMDYTKYFAANFVSVIDGKKVNLEQWAAHQQNVKALMRSAKLMIDQLFSNGATVAVAYRVQHITQDGTEIFKKVFVFFQVHAKKITQADEMTQLINAETLNKKYTL